MERHTFRSTDASPLACSFRPHASALLCNQARSHANHTPAPPKSIAAQLGAGIAKAFPTTGEGPDLSAAEAAWQVHSTMVTDLLVTKRAYGDAWVDQGYMGNIARILSKTSRIKNVAWTDSEDTTVDPDDESMLDTLKDLSALCAFAIANIEDGNKWGPK